MFEFSPSGNEEIADCLELSIIASGNKGNPIHKIQKWATDWANLTELQVSSGLKVMERRQSLLHEKYPFIVNEFAVILNQNMRLSNYVYLLIATRPVNSVSWQPSAPTQEETELFEEFVSIALKGYLGESSEAIPFGWPSKIGRPVEFPLAIDWLANKLGLKLGGAFRPPRRKDGGVDVVAWRPFKDRRSGFPIYLVQCTLQKDFIYKSRDIDVRIWAGWLEMDHDPITILAVPRAIAPGETWNEITANSVIFERFRLLECLNSEISKSHQDYLEKMLNPLENFASSNFE